MTRRVFSGGRVLDGTGAPAAPADVVVEDGRIVEVGPGLDGDEVVDCTGATVLPGLFAAAMCWRLHAPHLVSIAVAVAVTVVVRLAA